MHTRPKRVSLKMHLYKSLFASLLMFIPNLASAHMVLDNAYARAASTLAQSGAAYMSVFNHSDRDDRLVAATSNIAERVELHTHIHDDTGLMRMVEVEDGLEISAGQTITLERGGAHVMFLGLRQPLLQDDDVEITLIFEHADPVTITISVDLTR